jgi:hypothetical protein
VTSLCHCFTVANGYLKKTRESYEASIPWRRVSSNIKHQRRGTVYFTQIWYEYFDANNVKIGSYFFDVTRQTYSEEINGPWPDREVHVYRNCHTWENE